MTHLAIYLITAASQNCLEDAEIIYVKTCKCGEDAQRMQGLCCRFMSSRINPLLTPSEPAWTPALSPDLARSRRRTQQRALLWFPKTSKLNRAIKRLLVLKTAGIKCLGGNVQPKASVLSDSTFGDPLRALIPDPFLLGLWPSQQASGRPPILGRPRQLLGCGVQGSWRINWRIRLHGISPCFTLIKRDL